MVAEMEVWGLGRLAVALAESVCGGAFPGATGLPPVVVVVDLPYRQRPPVGKRLVFIDL